MSKERWRMTAIPRKFLFAFEEFCLLVPEERKADLIDGVIYMASPELIEMIELGLWLG
jgi:hypothetical protein